MASGSGSFNGAAPKAELPFGLTHERGRGDHMERGVATDVGHERRLHQGVGDLDEAEIQRRGRLKPALDPDAGQADAHRGAFGQA